MHAGGALVVHLHAVHANVALSCSRTAGDDTRQSDEASTILRPALEDGKIQQRKPILLYDLLAWTGRNDLRKEFAHVGEDRQHFELFEEPFRGLAVQQFAD